MTLNIILRHRGRLLFYQLTEEKNRLGEGL